MYFEKTEPKSGLSPEQFEMLNENLLSLQVGWKTTREYYTFMWVSLPVDLNSHSAKQQEVQFKGKENKYRIKGVEDRSQHGFP